MSAPRDRSSFWKLVAKGEILSGLTSPADRRNLEMFCEDYEKLKETNDIYMEATFDMRETIVGQELEIERLTELVKGL